MGIAKLLGFLETCPDGLLVKLIGHFLLTLSHILYILLFVLQLELKDLRFSHHLKKACFDDIEKYCPSKKSK